MSNAQSVMQEINSIHAYIVRSVDRFISQQTISPENYRKLNKLKTDAGDIVKRANKVWDLIALPHNAELQQSRQAIEAEYQIRVHQLQSEYQVRKQQAQQANPINAVIHSQINQEHQAKLQGLEQEKVTKIQLKTEELETKNLRLESKDLSTLFQELENALNLFVEIEKSIKGEEVAKKAAKDFAANKDNFDQAALYHKRMAIAILLILSIILAGGIAILYYFFIKPDHRLRDLPAEPSASLLVAVMATALSGKVAFLLVWAWILRYLTNLHGIHSEQAVIYNDRSASLTIGESLLVAAPQLEQKTALLNTLAKGYLDIEKNAFRTEGSARKNSEASVQLGLVRELVNTVKPLLESLKSKEK